MFTGLERSCKFPLLHQIVISTLSQPSCPLYDITSQLSFYSITIQLIMLFVMITHRLFLIHIERTYSLPFTSMATASSLKNFNLVSFYWNRLLPYNPIVSSLWRAIESVRLLSYPPTRTHPVQCRDARTQAEMSFSPAAIGSARRLGW